MGDGERESGRQRETKKETEIERDREREQYLNSMDAHKYHTITQKNKK